MKLIPHFQYQFIRYDDTPIATFETKAEAERVYNKGKLHSTGIVVERRLVFGWHRVWEPKMPGRIAAWWIRRKEDKEFLEGIEPADD